MKKLVFVLFLFVGQSLSLPMYASRGADLQVAFRVNPDKSVHTGNIARSLSPQPVEAFISNDQLSIRLLNFTANVTVTLTNTLTGEVVSSNFFEMTEGTVIPLDSEGSGEYQLEVTSPEWSFLGDFSL